MSGPVSRRLGLGTGPLGGLYMASEAAAARATVDRAWELGVRYFDTAPAYGSGLAERRLGEALRERPREQFAVSTKVGRLLRPGSPNPMFKGAPELEPVVDFTPGGVRRSLQDSLERLQLDRVDIVFIHDPEGHLDDALAALETLREIGVEIGVGTNSVETALAFARDGAIDRLLLAGRYTPLDNSAGDTLLGLCAEYGIPVTAGGVFNSGLLAGGTTFDYAPAADPHVIRTRKLAAVCARHAVPLAAVALQFPFRHPAISNILVGARTAREIEQDVELLSHPIPDELWREPLLAWDGWPLMTDRRQRTGGTA